ncbi:MAG: SAVED domain-containing protein [Actinomycetota bacterium]|nr:SAVED domain-containing protein [Actinomycetota bacterium]
MTADDTLPPLPTDAMQARKLSKADLTEMEKIKVWVRAGGVCVLCHDYLLEGTLSGLGVALGELAHIVGQKNSARSPRGLNPLPTDRRDDADNVLLACAGCHNEIDKKLIAGVLDVERLGAMKASHEAHIRHVTTLPHDAQTLVLRMLDGLRGEPVDVTRATVTSAVTAAGRWPWFGLDRLNQGVEIDLRGIPGEETADQAYYRTAAGKIDEVLEHKLREAVAADEVRHVSVFPFARLPLIIHLGSRLSDNFTVAPYQRHRDNQTWDWDPAARPSTFTAAHDDLRQASEVLLVLNISGTVDVTALDPDLADLPTITVTPDRQPSPDVLRSLESLAALCQVLREVNATLDAHKATVTRVHVVGAVPPAAAIEVGRLHERHVHPPLALYSLDDGHYRYALEIA